MAYVELVTYMSQSTEYQKKISVAGVNLGIL